MNSEHNTLIAIAMPEEAELVKVDGDVIVTGVGALNVMKALRNVDRRTKIVNIGYAGSKGFEIGDVVKVGEVKLYHPEVEYEEETFKLDGDVACYTSCDFVTKTDIKTPCVFDMELAFILAMGFKNVVAYKVVSDCLDINQFEKTLAKV